MARLFGWLALLARSSTPVQVDRVREGARYGRLQAREFLLDRRAMLGVDLVTQFFEHGAQAAHDLDRGGAVFADLGHAEGEVVSSAASRDHQAGTGRLSACHRDRDRSVVPIRRMTLERWSSAWTAVVGSSMAGDRALSATSTTILTANAGSCSIVRSSPARLCRGVCPRPAGRRRCRRRSGSAGRRRARNRRPGGTARPGTAAPGTQAKQQCRAVKGTGQMMHSRPSKDLAKMRGLRATAGPRRIRLRTCGTR